MESEAVEKTVKNNYDFVYNKSTPKIHDQRNKEKIQKRPRECYRNISDDKKNLSKKNMLTVDIKKC